MERVGTSGAVLAPDTWLSELLRRPTFSVRDTTDVTSVADALPMAPAFVTAKVPAHRADDAVALQAIGFRVVDTALTFAAEVTEAAGGEPCVRPAQRRDEAAVAAIAATVFRYSRFHLDPGISRETANRIKEAWARNYFAGARGDGMVVAEAEDGAVVGFTQLLRGADGAVVIDLIAVAETATRRGFARAMIGHAARHGLDGRRPARLLVGTQAANIASCRLYESLGFRLMSSTFVLHHHGSAAGQGATRTRP